MTKSTKILIIIIVVLVVASGVLVYLNSSNVATQKEQNANAIIVFMENGEDIIQFTRNEVEEMGAVDFKANYKKSGKPAIEYTYTGVLLKKVFENANINLSDKTTIVATAADGYTVAIDIAKVLEDDNVYLTFKQEGEYLKGYEEEGGSGPFLVIISKDPFSQFWCKFASSVDAQ